MYAKNGRPYWRSSAGVKHRLAVISADLAVANGDNNDVAVDPDASLFRLTGPTAAFALTGVAGGEDGRLLILYNTTAQFLTLRNESAASAAANRILTMTGADVTLTAASTATFVYSGPDSRWLLLAAQG